LAVGNGADLKVGTPLVAAQRQGHRGGARRHDKVRIFKMRRRKHYQRHGGHRQNYTELQIGAVN
jgi:large subunit ribosomal protein L21